MNEQEEPKKNSELVAETLKSVLECAEAWEPDARLVGNVRAGDIATAMRFALNGRELRNTQETVGEKLARRYAEDIEKAVLKIVREDNPVMALVYLNELRRLLAEITEYANDFDREAIRCVASIHKRVGLQ